MRSATAALIALINSGNQEWVKADLYTWFDSDGNVLGRYTNADADLTVGGSTFSASGPIFKRDSVTTTVGIQVAEMKITVSADDTKLLGGVPWMRALREGVLDGGRLLVERFLSDSWANTAVGSVIWFGGRIGPFVAGRTQAQISIRSDVELLNVAMPRNPYQSECRHTLFDAGCTLSRSAFVVNSTVASGSTRQVINCGLARANKFFDLGRLQFTSGPNAGTWVSVRSYVVGVLTLMSPLANQPTVGDAFNVSPGCDKLQATCGTNVSKTFTVNDAFDEVISINHGFADGTAVRLSSTGVLPSPLTSVSVYFVQFISTNTFFLASAIDGGTPFINITDTGSGVHSIVVAGKFGNLPNFGGFPYIPSAESVSAL